MIQITNHSCIRYIERFNQNLNSIEDENVRFDMARKAIEDIYNGAEYITNNENGVLFRNKAFNAELILHKGLITTIYPLNKKVKYRELKHKGPSVAEDQIIRSYNNAR